jgi:hypothetical protein
LIVGCAIAAIALAACSSSSKSASTATNPSGATTTNGSSGNGSGGGGGGGGDFCSKVKSDAQAFSSAGFTGKSAQDLKSVYSGLDAKLEQIKSDVPSAIKGDFDTYITFIKKFQKTLADANYDYTKLSPSDLVGLYSGNTGTALAHIGQYFAQNCHFSTPTT